MGVGMIVLYILGKIILYILIILLIFLLAVLLIPFKYNFSGNKLENTILEGSVSWLFGGLKMKFKYHSEKGISMIMSFLGFKKKLDPSNEALGKNKDMAQEHIEQKKKIEKPAYRYFTYEVLIKGLESIVKILNHCKPRQFNLNAQVGFDDPMYTGLLCAAQNAGFAILDKYDIHIQTMFEEEEVKGSFILGGSIQVFYLLLVAIGFVVTKPFRSLLIKNIKIKIKRRLKKWRIISISTKV